MIFMLQFTDILDFDITDIEELSPEERKIIQEELKDIINKASGLQNSATELGMGGIRQTLLYTIALR